MGLIFIHPAEMKRLRRRALEDGRQSNADQNFVARRARVTALLKIQNVFCLGGPDSPRPSFTSPVHAPQEPYRRPGCCSAARSSFSCLCCNSAAVPSARAHPPVTARLVCPRAVRVFVAVYVLFSFCHKTVKERRSQGKGGGRRNLRMERGGAYTKEGSHVASRGQGWLFRWISFEKSEGYKKPMLGIT